MEIQYLQNTVVRTFEVQALAQQAALQPQLALQAGALQLQRENRMRQDQVGGLAESAESDELQLSQRPSPLAPKFRRPKAALAHPGRAGRDAAPSLHIDLKA